MNKIISNHHISPTIIDLIKNSEKYVVLVSPYLWLWGHLKDEIMKCVVEREVKVLLIIKEFEKDSSKNKKKSSIQLNKRIDILEETLEEFYSYGVEVFTNESLHTKLYMSEKLSLISSMNLYDYSMKSNQELGVVFDDDDTRKQLNEYVKELKSNSISYQDSNDYDDGPDIPDRLGNCIRCGKSDIEEPPPMNDIDTIMSEIIDKELLEELRDNDEEWDKSNCYLCEDCLPIWVKYGSNVEYPEKYCFVCGEEHETSVKRPFCKDCTYERNWNDDDYKEVVRKKTEEWVQKNPFDE